VIVEIISTGNELLMGEVTNTNSTWLARILTDLGFEVRRITIVGDDLLEIASSIKEALVRGASVIILTGGLGPTPDDLTARALSLALNRRLELNEEALSMVARECGKRGVELNQWRRKMAYMPKGSRPLPNPLGMAPAIMIETDGRFLFALPGVPKEAYAIFKGSVLPILRKLSAKIGLKVRKSRYLIAGIREADIAPLLLELRKQVPELYVKTRVTARGIELLIQWRSSKVTSDVEYMVKDLLEKLKQKGVLIKELYQ